jgi:hypothetical protein
MGGGAFGPGLSIAAAAASWGAALLSWKGSHVAIPATPAPLPDPGPAHCSCSCPPATFLVPEGTVPWWALLLLLIITLVCCSLGASLTCCCVKTYDFEKGKGKKGGKLGGAYLTLQQ